MSSQQNFLLHTILLGEWYEVDYNPRVAGALSKAFAFITPTPRRRDAFQRARTHILPYANHRMSRRQRARILYILGVACMDEGAYPHAYDYLDEAFDHARALHGLAESAKLANLLGSIQEQAYRYTLASSYHAFTLAALAALTGGSGPYSPDPALAADAAVALASCHFALERYAVAERHLAHAAHHISYLPPGSKQLAALRWMQALFYRWHNEPMRALSPAQEAATLYRATGSTAAQSRIEGIIADCACDLAVSYASAGYGRYSYLDLARRHAKRALNLTADGTDVSGRALALLRQIRLARLTGTSYNWLGTAEAIIADVSSTGDRPMLTHAYTTLGDEFSARGERESGLRCYRAALDALAGTDALHLGRWSRYAILMDGEMREH